MIWLQENLLSLYGAVIGTLALFLNFGRLFLTYQKSSRKLKVSSSIAKEAQKKIDEFSKARENNDGNILCGPIYVVNVLNKSHFSIHICDVGLEVKTSRQKTRKGARIMEKNGFLVHLSDTCGDTIPAGTKKSYYIWLEKNLEIPNIVGCYVEDQLGTVFKGKHFSNNQELFLKK